MYPLTRRYECRGLDAMMKWMAFLWAVRNSRVMAQYAMLLFVHGSPSSHVFVSEPNSLVYSRIIGFGTLRDPKKYESEYSEGTKLFKYSGTQPQFPSSVSKKTRKYLSQLVLFLQASSLLSNRFFSETNSFVLWIPFQWRPDKRPPCSSDTSFQLIRKWLFPS